MKQITDSSDGREARWVDHRSRKRLELVRSARHSIHREGPGVSMEVIASDAGTSKSVFYRYFGGKDGLRSAVGADVVAQLRDAVVAAGAVPTTAAASLRAMILAYLQQAAASPNTYAFVSESEVTASPESVVEFTHDLAQLMRERLDDLNPLKDPEDLARIRAYAAIGLIRSAGEAWVASDRANGTGTGPVGTERLADSITAWLLAGLASQPTTSFNPAPSTASHEKESR